MIDQARQLLATVIFASIALGFVATAGTAAEDRPHPGTEVIPTAHDFETLWERLEQAVGDNGMGVVTRASASRGAAARGITIPGNAVIGVYRNDFAVRMLKASVAAGIEAPIRFYITDNGDGTATLTWRRPSAIFAPYKAPALDDMARELDAIFEKIARQATGP